MNKVMLLVLALLASSFFTGCKNNLPREIDKSLFTNIEYVYMGLELSSKGYKLSRIQESILRKSISECISIEEIDSEEADDEYNNSGIVIIVKKINNRTANLRYDLQNGYLYIEKIDTYQGDPEKIMMNRELSEKYLEGFYRIKTSSEFEQLLNPLMKN